MNRNLVALLALALMSNANASDTTFQFFEEEATVMTAAKHPQKLADAPASTHIISADDIARYGYRTIAEALQSVPGIYVSNDRNYSYVWFRGFGIPGDYNSRILFLINGHRANDNTYGFTSPDHTFTVDIKTVDRIEVVKGPGSALYGDNAVFGVINIITKTAQNTPAAQINVEHGSYGTSKAYVSVSHRSLAGPELYVAASSRWMSGQDHYYPEFSTINNGVAENVDNERDYDVYASLSYAGFVLNLNDAKRLKELPTGAWASFFNDPDNQTKDHIGFLELKTDRDLGAGMQFSGRVYYDWYDYEASLDYENTTPPPATILNQDTSTERWGGEEMRLRFNLFGQNNALTLGQEYESTFRSIQDNWNVDPYTLNVHIDKEFNRWAFYLQQELNPSAALGLTLGVRYDHYNTFGSTTNPRISAVYHITGNDTLKLSYGSAFRAPNPYEMFWADFATYKPNPDLKPERIHTQELTWEHHVKNKGTLSLGYFHTHLNHLIEDYLDIDGLYLRVNSDKTSSEGVEFSYRWKFAETLSGHFGYLYQNTKRESGLEMVNSPHHTGSFGLIKLFQPYHLTLALDSFYVGERKTFQYTHLPDSAQFNLTLSAMPWQKDLKAYLSVYNLTDADYAVTGGAEHAQAAIPQNGRNYNFGVELQF